MAIVEESRMLSHINAANPHSGSQPTIPLGTTAQYFRGDRTWQDLPTAVRNAPSTGLSTTDVAELAAGNTILQNLGRARNRINQRPIRPQTGSGIGQWYSLNRNALTAALILPVGGTWAAYIWIMRVGDINSVTGDVRVTSGGATLHGADASVRTVGFAWRIT